MITPSWLSGSLRSFLYNSVYSCHLFSIFSASVKSLPFYCAQYCMKCSLDILIFLKRSLVFPILLFSSIPLHSLITAEGFLISPCISLELCIQMGISFLFSFAFNFSSQLFVRPPQTTIFPFCLTHFECLSVSCGGMGQQWPATGTGSVAAADLGHAVLPTIELPSR